MNNENPLKNDTVNDAEIVHDKSEEDFREFSPEEQRPWNMDSEEENDFHGFSPEEQRPRSSTAGVAVGASVLRN